MTRFASYSTLIRKLGTPAVVIGSMLLSFAARGQVSNDPGLAQIMSVGPISPKAWQTIVVKGTHFGTNPPINGCPDHLRVTDVTTNWSIPAVGPFGGCQAGIFVSSWNDTEIVIEGFPSFPRGQDAFKIGDVIKIEVSNAQQGGPTAWNSLRVTPAGTRPSPVLHRVPVSTHQESPPGAPVTIPAGTKIVIRMVDSLDSSKSKIGDVFQASLEDPVVVGDTVVAPKGADVYGKIALAKSAGRISGAAELKLEMTGIRIKDNIVPVESTHYDEVAKGRGKQSAERIGGGVAAGSIIGAFASGAKGVPIGAGVGAAAATVAQLATHPKQIRITSETVLEFELQQPVTVPAADASVGTSEGASPPVEVGSSSAPIAPGSTDDMVSPPAEETSSVEVGSSSAPIAPGSTDDKVSPSVQTASYDENAAAFVVTSSNDFGEIDLTTGKYTQIGHMEGVPKSLGGLGTLGGKLYGGAIRTGNLYEVDASSGTVTLVGTGKLSYFVTGSTTDALYAVGQDLSLYSIDARSGVATLIGPTGFNPANVGGGALSSGSETLYMSVGTNLSGGATLYSLNTSTGAAMAIGSLGPGTGAPPMVFERDTLYAALNFPSRKICRLNTTTGVPACFASTSGVPGYIYGLAYSSSLSTNQVASRGIAAATVEDDFTSDHSLNQSIWTTHGEALKAMVNADTRFVPVRLSFSSLGMAIAGVVGKFQSTGIQSARSFSTPLTLEARVMGRIANGNPFALYLVNADGAQYLTVNGNLNRGNVGYYGLALGYTGLGKDAANPVRRGISQAVSVNVWYVIRVTVDARGTGTVVVEDLQGSRLATENNLTVGTGPFFVVLAQWEGWPHTVGPNEAVWGKVAISAASPEAISKQPVEADPGAEKSVNRVIAQRTGSASSPPRDGQAVKAGIRSVDSRNFEYRPDCLEETVRVSNGEWKEVKENEVNYFRIVSVNYGDLKGDGQDEAVVWGACGGVANVEIDDLIIFSTSPEGPRLMAELSRSDWGKGEENNGVFQISDIHVVSHQLRVSFYAGGYRAAPAWIDTATFQWVGNRLVRTRLDRKPFKPSSSR